MHGVVPLLDVEPGPGPAVQITVFAELRLPAVTAQSAELRLELARTAVTPEAEPDPVTAAAVLLTAVAAVQSVEVEPSVPRLPVRVAIVGSHLVAESGQVIVVAVVIAAVGEGQ